MTKNAMHRISSPGKNSVEREPTATMMLRESAPLVCWVVVNGVPYHHARLLGVAAGSAIRACMIELTDVDEFKVLEHRPASPLPYERYALFHEIPWSKLDGRAMARALGDRLSQIKPHAVCVNGWSFGGCLAAIRWCVDNRVPAILMSDSTAYDGPRRWWKEAVKRRIVRLCAAGFVGGAPHVAYLAALGIPRDRIVSGYDVVDNRHFLTGADAARRDGDILRRKLGLPEHYFLACSRFTPKKNLFRLLEAFALYRRRAGAGACSLVVLGDGPLKSQLLEARQRLGLVEAALLLGAKQYHELPAYYGLADAFVHASTSEQWGLVVNEAMAAGLPVLVSERCGCAPDLVEDGRNGYRFDPYDPAAMADAMARIAAAACDREAMGRAGREIIARWSPERFAEGLRMATEAAFGAPPPQVTALDRLLLWGLRHR